MNLELFLYLLLGHAVGAFGTMIGAGGGFILVPILMALHPAFSSEQITAVSLLCVAINASSGSLSYLMQKKVHLKAAFIFIMAGLPGVWLGTTLTRAIPRERFQGIFGVSLVLISLFLLWRSSRTQHKLSEEHQFSITNKQYFLGGLISIFVGVLASFLGIGGGIIHVPLLIHWIKFPVHLATGTSHLILAVTAIAAVATHYFHSDYPQDVFFMWPLGIGMLVGAQIGAKYSSKLKGAFILKALYFAVLLVGVRLIIRSL